MVLFVGEPENIREKSDPTEFEALIPYTVNAMPAANKANPIPLFTAILSFSLDASQETERAATQKENSCTHRATRASRAYLAFGCKPQGGGKRHICKLQAPASILVGDRAAHNKLKENDECFTRSR
jgi:hypothetical protein